MRKAGDIISELFRENFGIEFSDKSRKEVNIFLSWPDVVKQVWADENPAIETHAKIRELERGELLIEADHPGWIQILQTKQKELLSVFQLKFPQQEIKSVNFRLGK